MFYEILALQVQSNVFDSIFLGLELRIPSIYHNHKIRYSKFEYENTIEGETFTGQGNMSMHGHF